MNKSDRLQLKTLPRRAAARAFTLIEILIVIALTAVLFALLIIPLVSALRYTQQAQIVTAAQDAARVTKERITRELSSAIFVFDGTSHPFQLPTGTTIAAGDDKYTNFLDLQILDKNGSPVVAHAYNAKLDFVLPKLNGTNATIDPTTNEPIAYTQSQNGSAIISNPSFVFPLAAGTTMIRYFVGLKDPTISYNNTREGKSITSTDNTYVLYRAQIQPYVPNPDGSKSVVPDYRLFSKHTNSNGVDIPELDDPDFFRCVNIKPDGTAGPATDTNWLDDAHGLYPAQTAISFITKTAPDGTAAPHDYPDGSPEQHNYRVEQWIQIAKTVIPGPNVDLILLPHNADNTLDYDTSGTFINVAHSGVATDPVTNASYPIINTSVTFRPATVSGNATPGTTSEYNSQGAVSVDQSGFTYIPTVYTATSQSWSLPYHVSLYPGNYDPSNAALSMYYDTDQFAGGMTPVTPTASNLSINPGDIIEYLDDSNGRNPVYDVTQGFPFTVSGTTYTLGGTQFVPMTISPDNGTITFSAPYLPNGPTDRFTRSRTYGALDTTSNASQDKGGIDANGILDLTLPVSSPAALTDSPLQGSHIVGSGTTATPTGDLNAHIVPGSVRVMGPDQTSGPNAGQPITYTEVNSSVGTVSDNQFSIDYGAGSLHFLPGTIGPVSVIYDYQANMTLDSTSNTYQPMQVKVDYQTRDLIDVSIGVRIYDVTNNRAQVIPAETKIKIGNSNR